MRTPSSCSIAVGFTMSAGIQNCWRAATSTAIFGISKRGMSCLRVGVKSRRSGTPALSDKRSQLAVVRQFQSETDAIREAPEPRYARITVFVLTGFIVSCVTVMALTTNGPRRQQSGESRP